MVMRTQFKRRSDEVQEREQDAVWILCHAVIFSPLFKRNKQARKRVKQKYSRRLIYEQDRKLFLLLIGEDSLDDVSPELRRRYERAMQYAEAERALGRKIRKRVKLGRAVDRLVRMMR